MTEREVLVKALWTWIQNKELVRYLIDHNLTTSGEIFFFNRRLSAEILSRGQVGADYGEILRMAFVVCDDRQARKMIARQTVQYVPEIPVKEVFRYLKEIRQNISEALLLRRDHSTPNTI